MIPSADPIVAIATAPGRGAIGIVRVSGNHLTPLIQTLCGRTLPPREATYTTFVDAQGQAIDRGLAIHFPAPHSFTGEDVLELQLDALHVGHRVGGAIGEAGAAAVGVAAGEVVGDQHQHPLPALQAAAHVVLEHLAQVRPAQVEEAAEVTEGLDDARRGVGGDGDVDPPVHALEHRDGGWVARPVQLPGQAGFRVAVGGRITAGHVVEPVDAIEDGLAVHAHGASAGMGTFRL